jgi:hypothetical protein
MASTCWASTSRKSPSRGRGPRHRDGVASLSGVCLDHRGRLRATQFGRGRRVYQCARAELRREAHRACGVLDRWPADPQRRHPPRHAADRRRYLGRTVVAAQTCHLRPLVRFDLGQCDRDRLVPAAQESLPSPVARRVHRGVRARNVPGVAPNLARCSVTFQRRNTPRRGDRADARAPWIHAGGGHHPAGCGSLPSWGHCRQQ